MANIRKQIPVAVQYRHSGEIHLKVFETALGWMAILGESRGVVRLGFGFSSEQESISHAQKWEESQVLVQQSDTRINTEVTEKWMRKAESLLVAYAAGEPVDLSEIPVVLEGHTAFSKKVCERLRKVPYGEVIAYGELAEQAGSRGAARAVGTVMSKNRIPILIPCHRTLAAGGKIGGYSAADGVSTKKRLLRLENPHRLFD
ncbi:methylated-DNA--[protein]-cysteine S-methyltransferase [Planctomicrobium sp. SH668]|uniref:methylated-DNA--[protein]-cysteine S-methyltransferase n=1 Tax=Planctomicrobium sp. SH668 TaxID=3448126 RepID=UPI003F5C85B8